MLERQPQLIEVRLKLAKILQLMGQEAEAIAVYESALSKAGNQATRQHIVGAIAVFRPTLRGQSGQLNLRLP